MLKQTVMTFHEGVDLVAYLEKILITDFIDPRPLSTCLSIIFCFRESRYSMSTSGFSESSSLQENSEGDSENLECDSSPSQGARVRWQLEG